MHTGTKPGFYVFKNRTVDQLVDSLAALEIELDESEHARLDAAAPPESVAVSYSQYKGPHQFHW